MGDFDRFLDKIEIIERYVHNHLYFHNIFKYFYCLNLCVKDRKTMKLKYFFLQCKNNYT